MESDLDFQTLVRQSGIVFTTDTGQGPEEWVLAIATPNLSRTQVATQSDLVAAGYIRAEALKRLEAERDRLSTLLRVADEHISSLNESKTGVQQQLNDMEQRAKRGEAWRQAEHEGVVARNRGEDVDANPYKEQDPISEVGHQAWRHGFRVRDTLIGLNERIRNLGETLDATRQSHAEEVSQLQQNLRDLESTSQELTGELARLRQRNQQLESDQRHLPDLEEAVRLAWSEAPHSPDCALWAVKASGGDTVLACDCWRARVAVEALAPFTAR